MSFDEPEKGEPLPIRSIAEARIAAQAVLDWTDYNLTCFDAADCMDVADKAKASYESAKALVAALSSE